jgi:hypothetical protein
VTERYTGRPFLKLVDSYILDAIGHLSAADDAALEHGWRATVEREMKFPAGFAGAVREMWDKGRVKFVAAQGHEPDPAQFTQSFVDSKFPH